MDDNVCFRFINRATHKSGSFVANHSHTCDELVFYRSGDGETVINGTSYVYVKNSLAVIKSGFVHNEYRRNDTRVFFIGFESKNPNLQLRGGVFNYDSHSMISGLLEQLFDEATKQRANYEAMISCKLTELLVCISRSNDIKSFHGKNMTYCANYLSENFNQPVNLKELACIYGYSYDYFRHVFKKEIGVPPKNFIMERRLEHAHNMLASSGENCTQIAYACGFSDSAQFSKIYKKRFGDAPSAVRK